MNIKHTLSGCNERIRNIVLKEDWKWRKSFPTALRSVVVFCLFACLVIFGIFSYMLMWNTEDTIFRDNFSSSSRKLSDKMISLLHTISQDGHTVSNYQSVYYPSLSDWPYAYINGFESFAETLKASSTTFGGSYVLPIVNPENVSAFETYMQKMYEQDEDVPADAAMNDFGFGISATNLTTGEIYHDVDGGGGGGENTFLAPIAAYVDQYEESHYLRSVYTDLPIVTKGVDGVYACLQAGNTSCQAMMAPDYSGPLPGTLLVTPIAPRNYPNDTVGFAVTAFTWTVLLNEGVVILSNDMQMVISTTDDDHFTALSHNGNVIVEGRGDLHDREYGVASHSSSFTLPDTQAAASVTYVMTIYPTKAYYDKFHTSLPLTTTLLTVAMIVATAIFMKLYDRFMKKDNETKRLLLEGKRQFVRFVSHEIRTPLNAAMLGLQLMDDRVQEQLNSPFIALPAEDIVLGVRTLSEEVRLNADVALVVLNELLQYDKVEVGTMQLDVGIVDIWRLVLDNIYMFSAQVQHTGIHLNVKDPSMDTTISSEHKNLIGSLHVKGDGIRLAQAIRNLVSNALKFSKRNDPLDLTLEWNEHGLSGASIPHLPESHFAAQSPVFRRGSVIFSVTDRGPGMSPEEVAALFGEGAQFQPNQLQAGEGSGLGLFISKGIVEIHGGKIWAYSDGYGYGSTFCIELPLCGNEEGPPPSLSMDDFDTSPSSALSALSAAVRKQVLVRKPVRRKQKTGWRRGKKKSNGRHNSYSYLNRLDSVRIDEEDEDEEEADEEEDNKDENDENEVSEFDGIEMKQQWEPPAPSHHIISSRRGSDLSLGSHRDKAFRLRHTSSDTFGRDTEEYEKPRSILIVEDAESNRKMLGVLLERRGFICDYAVDGVQCLEMLTNFSDYDVILMDYIMPQMTGPEATRIIRETYGSIHIVVGLTGNVMAEDVAFFKEHGADAVLSKPLEVSDFLVSLDEIRSQRTMSSEFPDEFRDDVY